MVKKSTVFSILVLLWLRWFISGLPGYIHPDEFFQNPEITSSKIFGIQTFTPWEYQPQNAARSIVAPFFTTGIPFLILKWTLPNESLPSASKMFAAERYGSFAWSLIIGVSKPFIPMTLIATSHVTLAYYTHPFSNSFESILLCLCLLIYIEYVKAPSSKMSYYLGLLFSLGVFTRVTFPLYASPIGVFFLISALKRRQINHVISLAIGVALSATFCMFADSLYYETLMVFVNHDKITSTNHLISSLLNPISLISTRIKGSLVVAPINNLIYNMNMNNLQQHGIHPRYTHLTVNLPLLFGPLATQIFLESPSVFKRGVSGPNSHVFGLLVSIVSSGLIGLSVIPHQEARFLCPLLLPLVLIYTWKQPKLSVSFWAAWVVFNIITTYIFGVAHQGGVIPAMGFLNYQTSGINSCYILENGGLACNLRGKTATDTIGNYNITTNLVFYKTYMPPQHLLVKSLVRDSHSINLLDFSSRYEDLVKKLEHCSGVVLHKPKPGEIRFAKTSIDNTYERTLFIVPSFIDLPKVASLRYMLIASFSHHVSFDDIDKMISRAEQTNSPETQMNLNVFLLMSDKNAIL